MWAIDKTHSKEEETLMTEFPRTTVGDVSLPRLLIGTNWFLGYSHTSLAKDNFIREHQTQERKQYSRKEHISPS